MSALAAIELPSSRTFRYWGKQGSGFYDPKTVKGAGAPNGLIFKGKKWKANYSGNSTIKPRHWSYLLRQNAQRRGKRDA